MVELSRAQIDAVVCVAATGGVAPLLFSRLPRVRQALEADPLLLKSTRHSASLFSGLLLLSCFPPDGSWFTTSEAARLTGMAMSTTHRYISTFVEAGLLVRDPRSRAYRLAVRGLAPAPSPTDVESGHGGGGIEAGDDTPVRRVELSAAQVREVLRAAADMETIAALLSGLIRVSRVPDAAREQLEDDPRRSSSLLAGLVILGMLPLDGSLVSNARIARMLDMNPSTTHRYISTLRAVGLVDRDEGTRHYGLAV